MKNLLTNFKVLLLSLALLVTSCSNDDDLTASVSVSPGSNDFDGNINGNGGDFSKTYTWNNNSTTADYNMNLTASKVGSYKIMIKDDTGSVVMEQSLTSGTAPDSKSGVTSTGAAGSWSITITLSNFDGNGSFSISSGQ